MKRRWLAFSVVVLALTTASASSRADEPGGPAASGTVVLTQEEALARFRVGSFDLLAKKYEVSAARADVLGAGLLANPQIGVTGAFLLHGVPSGGNKELYLTVTQNAPFAGQLGLRRDAAKGFATAAERELAAEAWLLANDVRLAHLDLQLADGKALDPFTGRAPDRQVVLRGRFGDSALWTAYTRSIRRPAASVYREELRRTIRGLARGVGKDARVVSGDILWVSRPSPEPGQPLQQTTSEEVLFGNR